MLNQVSRFQEERGTSRELHREATMSHTNEMSPRTFLKPTEVASLFNVSLSTVYSWYRAEMIQGIKIGGCVRIYQHSLGGSSVARESGPTRTILTSIG